MPIRASERARYPADWPAISARVRDEAGQKCEWCSAPNGVMIRRGTTHDCRHVWREASASAYENGRYDDGSEAPDSGEDTCDYAPAVRVVLTVAHLGMPAHLPLLLHVAGDAMADEVVDLVGFLMPLDAKAPEWHTMMHNRATAEFLTGSAASRARFLIPLPSSAPRSAPARTVVFRPNTAAPVWVGVSGLRLLRKPLHAASVSAEPTPLPVPVSAGLEGLPAAFAGKVPEASLGCAYVFSATGKRTCDPSVRNLLRCDWECRPAYWTDNTGRGFSGSCHTTLYHFGEYPENCSRSNLKALCQRCHLRYDARHHAANAAETRRSRKAVGDLFPIKKDAANG